MKRNFWDWLAIIILVVGGLNWGFLGFFGFDAIGAIFGEMSAFTRFIYAVVGLAALYEIIALIVHTSEETHGQMARRSM